MITFRALVMTSRTCVVLAVTILSAAACGGNSSSPGSHPASPTARPLSCRQQFQNWEHGPAQAGTSMLKEIQAAGQSGDAAGMTAAMKQLIPAALAMAAHPMPHCADPASLYPKLVTRIYAVGTSARSAHGLSARQAAAALRGLTKIRHQLTAEINRTVGQPPVTAGGSPPAN